MKTLRDISTHTKMAKINTLTTPNVDVCKVTITLMHHSWEYKIPLLLCHTAWELLKMLNIYLLDLSSLVFTQER